MVKIVMPAGVSAIFEPFIYPDPFISGARGAGFGVENAVEVEVSVSPSDKLSVVNYINGEKVEGGIGHVSVKTFFEIMGIEPKYSVEIRQKINVPIGAGFGTSAGSSLGVILALSRALGVPLTIVEAGDIAHVSEIRARTGLGTVSGLVSLGAIVVISRHGPPSLCLVDHIIMDGDEIYVLLASRGKKETSLALKDVSLLDRASKYGKVIMDKLIKEPTIENFFCLARVFAERTGLAAKQIMRLIDEVGEYAIGAIQAMIGDSIAVVSYRENVDTIKNIIMEILKTDVYVGSLVRSGLWIHPNTP